MRLRDRLIVCSLGTLGMLISIATTGVAQSPTPDARFGIVEAYVNAEAASEAGAGYTRIILRWDLIQPASGVDWKPANVPDPFIEAELAAGREVIAMLVGTPAWATADRSNDPRAVPDMSYWENFVRRVAQQYQGRIRHWVIWNEPDVWDTNHPGSTWLGTEQDYYRLLRTAYLAIKDVDANMLVHMAGLTYFWDQQHNRRQYLERLLDVILADPDAAAHGYYFDGVVYHLYYKPLQAPDIIGLVQSTLGGRGIMAKEIWINETNAPPSEDAQEPPRSAPRFRVSLEEQAAFVIQEFSLAFAAGADRVEFYKMRNSTDHPESVEPYGMLRADDSHRPVFDAYRAMTTYLHGFRSAQWERFGNVHVVTFDRGDTTTTVLWTMGRDGARFAMNAIASKAVLVDEQGETQTLTADTSDAAASQGGGIYVVDLPGAKCTERADCFIGGAPRMVVEVGSPGSRRGVIPIARLTSTPTPAVATPTAPAESPTVLVASVAPAPSQTAKPMPAPTATLTPAPVAEARRAATVVRPQPLPTPLPPITPWSILTPARCLILGLLGLGVFAVTYGLQIAVVRRLRR
jgi:hypothetical protein